MRTKSFCIGLLLSGSLLAHVIQANAQTYTFTDLGTLGGTNSYANAINNAGQVVGWSYLTGDNEYRATLWNGTTATDLGTLGGGGSMANAINSSGQVAGYSYTTSNAAYHATLWDGTTPTDIGPVGRNSMAYGINDSGQVVGFTQSKFDVSYYAAQWNGSTWTDLSSELNSQFSSSAYGINNAGQVVGSSYGLNASTTGTSWSGTTTTNLGTLSGATAINSAGQVAGTIGSGQNVTHAALWNGTTTINLDSLGGPNAFSHATAINNAGQVVGWSDIGTYTSEYDNHATLWNGTTAIDLNSFLSASDVTAGWKLIGANGINDSGEIVGYAYNSISGANHAFLLAAVPEPETYAMMLAGLGLLGFTARHRSIRKRLS